MLSFFIEKFPPYFAGVGEEGDTMLYLQIFPHFEKSIPNFGGKNYELSSKTT